MTKKDFENIVKSANNKHISNTEKRTKAVNILFDKAIFDICKAVVDCKEIDPEKEFDFNDYPRLQKIYNDRMKQLSAGITTLILSGIKTEWAAACNKNNKIIDSIVKNTNISREILQEYKDRNLQALKEFQSRKINGMSLSERVWQITEQAQTSIQAALDVGLGEGKGAASLARDVKRNLNEPDRLFRRVRDIYGNLQLSKNARAYHPGQGVYRSSVKNAQRLTRSEINIAYRTSDFNQYNNFDFVLGIEVQRAKKEHLFDCPLCDKLTGKYPKDFKFVGWHPQCLCFTVPVLMDEKTFVQEMKRKREAKQKGEKYYPSVERIKDVPQGFKDYIKNHKNTIQRMQERGKEPYFMRDNEQYIMPEIHPETQNNIRKIPLSKEEKRQLRTNYEKKVKKLLSPTKINNDVTRRKIVKVGNEDIVVNRDFFKETFNKNNKNPNIALVMNFATNFKEWLPKMRYIGTEDGRHHEHNFKVYRVIYKNMVIELKAKETRGIIAYTMRIL